MDGESWHIPVALILPFLSIQSQNIYIFYIIMMMMMSAFVDIHTGGNSMELVLFFYFYVDSDDQI